MSGMEGGVYWLLAILVILAVVGGCFAWSERRRTRLEWRDRAVAVEAVLDEAWVAAGGVGPRPYSLVRSDARPFDWQRDPS